MSSDILPLPGPPRRVLAAPEGALIIELEDHVARLPGKASILEKVCVPETKGERLLWAPGPKQCVMLGPRGTLKLYEAGKIVQTRDGVLLEDEELVGTADAGNHSAVILAARMAGEGLQLATPEYRFVWVTPELAGLGGSRPALKRRPSAWGIFPRGKRVFALLRESEMDAIRMLRLDRDESLVLARPPNLGKKEVTGLGVEWTTGEIALTVAGDRQAELAIATAEGGTYSLLAVGADGERFDQPAWSPDGAQLLFRRTLDGTAVLAVIETKEKLPKPVCPVAEGDEWLWVDPQTIAVVKWDRIERREISPLAAGPATPQNR